MVGIQKRNLFVNIWAVLRRLKRIRLKILFIIFEIKGNVVSFFPCFFNSAAQTAETTLESTPPDKKVQIGTSDTICLLMAS